MMRRILALALSLCLCVTMLPTPALAEVMPDSESREKPAAAVVTEPDPEETEPVSRRPEKLQGERRPARTWVSREDLLTEDDVMEEGRYVYRVITLDDGTQAASIALYDGEEKNVEIPAELGGYPVAALEGEAFNDNEYIQSVTVPEGLTTIGAYAFSSSGLKVLTLPDSVTTIENDAFSYCERLEEIWFGRGITSIDEYAFDETTDFIAWVWSGSYAEEYMIAHNIPDVHLRENTPSQTGGVLTVPVNPDLYAGMQLVVTAGGRPWTRTIDGQADYVFTGLTIGSACAVSIRDQKGETVMDAGSVTVTTDSAVTVADAPSLGYVVRQNVTADQQGRFRLTIPAAPRPDHHLCRRLCRSDHRPGGRPGSAKISWKPSVCPTDSTA